MIVVLDVRLHLLEVLPFFLLVRADLEAPKRSPEQPELEYYRRDDRGEQRIDGDVHEAREEANEEFEHEHHLENGRIVQIDRLDHYERQLRFIALPEVREPNEHRRGDNREPPVERQQESDGPRLLHQVLVKLLIELIDGPKVVDLFNDLTQLLAVNNHHVKFRNHLRNKTWTLHFPEDDVLQPKSSPNNLDNKFSEDDAHIST